MKALDGIPASHGFAFGPAFPIARMDIEFKKSHVDDPSAEWDRFEVALAEAGRQLGTVYQRPFKECGVGAEI